MDAIDPGQVLTRGEQAADEGRFEDALRDYVWFHEHALEHQPSQYGVRLSFALRSWLDLVEVYPPALDALKEIRDRKTKTLLDGAGDRGMFHDVETINEYLGELPLTYSLFAELHARFPSLAERCADLAMPALIARGDFGIARKYIIDPVENVRIYTNRLNENIARAASQPEADAVIKAFTSNYVRDVSEVLTVLEAAGEIDAARSIRRLAIDSVDSAEIGEPVKRALLPTKIDVSDPRPNSK